MISGVPLDSDLELLKLKNHSKEATSNLKKEKQEMERVTGCNHKRYDMPLGESAEGHAQAPAFIGGEIWPLPYVISPPYDEFLYTDYNNHEYLQIQGDTDENPGTVLDVDPAVTANDLLLFAESSTSSEHRG